MKSVSQPAARFAHGHSVWSCVSAQPRPAPTGSRRAELQAARVGPRGPASLGVMCAEELYLTPVCACPLTRSLLSQTPLATPSFIDSGSHTVLHSESPKSLASEQRSHHILHSKGHTPAQLRPQPSIRCACVCVHVCMCPSRRTDQSTGRRAAPAVHPSA